MTTSADFWDKVAPKYAKSAIADQAAYEYTLERTRSYLKRSDKALELGCGTGSTALELAPSTGHITALDISTGMTDIAREKAAARGIENVRFDVADNAPDDGQFDVIMGFNLFHLVPDMEKRFARIHALLSPDGYFITKTPCLGQKGGGAKGLMMRLVIRVAIPVMQLMGKAPFVCSFTIAELETAITSSGFEIVESSNHPKGPPPARYIVARKANNS